MSDAGPISLVSPSACSGDMFAGVPMMLLLSGVYEGNLLHRSMNGETAVHIAISSMPSHLEQKKIVLLQVSFPDVTLLLPCLYFL